MTDFSKTPPASATNVQDRSLWRSRIKRWLKPPRRIRATATGKVVLIFTVLLGAAAVNTGNNLLYLILGSMFGLISASGILSERAMKNLEVKRSLGRHLFAGQPVELVYQINNPKRAAAYLIELFEEKVHSAQDPPLFPHIPAYEVRSKRTVLIPERRGRLTLSEVRIQTRYPFDFYERSYTRELLTERWVAPAPIEHGPPPLATASETEMGIGRWHSEKELDRVRPMIPGDPLRNTHWKKTAANDKFMMRDGENLGGDAVTLSAVIEAGDETALENLCFWLLHYLDKHQAVFLAWGNEALVPVQTGDESLDRALAMLAEFPSETPKDHS